MTDTDPIREAIIEFADTPSRYGKREAALTALDALVARLEAAEAVARAAVHVRDRLQAEDDPSWDDPSALTDLCKTIAAWERSQETGQP